MATAEQIKSLIRSFLSSDEERFYTIALQVAAHEAQQGHGALAHEIREIIDKARQVRRDSTLKFPNELKGLVISEKPSDRIASLIIPSILQRRVERIIHEYRQMHKLKMHGLMPRRKIMLVGPPGTGKTFTSKVLAHELRLLLYTIQVDRLVTKFMGETSAKLRQIFDLIQQSIGVYLFDEFDAIGGERSLGNDVGEMRRVLNSYLQFIEQDTSDSLIIAATNSPKLLDRALFRRFDDVLYYSLPQEEERKHLMLNILGSFKAPKFSWSPVLIESKGLSHSEISQACRDAIKQAILDDKDIVNSMLLIQMLKEKQSARSESKS